MKENVPLERRLDALFRAIDAKDTETFLDYLTEDASFRFGSSDAITGRDAIRQAVDGFFSSIAGSTHALKKTLRDSDTIVCEGTVTYHRHDGSDVIVPFTDVFELAGEHIAEYKIYIDLAPLFA